MFTSISIYDDNPTVYLKIVTLHSIYIFSLLRWNFAVKVSTEHAACVERRYSNYKRRNESWCCRKDWKR